MFDIIKKYGRCLLSLRGFCYDWNRYVRYNAWKIDLNDLNVRNYHISKIAHTLEKSMSYKETREGAGYANSIKLLNLLKSAENKELGLYDKIGAMILRKFCTRNINDNKFLNILNQIPNYPEVDSKYGMINMSESDFHNGCLNEPEAFFNSRFTLREFKNKKVEKEILHRALLLAQKTPSSCNMQPWHVYSVEDEEQQQTILKYQTGNRGFGHKIQNLLIITADQSSFISSSERYQHWIDGGLYAMSLIYALHSLGVASCCLNWSEDPKKDKEIRKNINIKGNHSIVLILAYGYPDNDNLVCASPRKNINDVLTVI